MKKRLKKLTATVMSILMMLSVVPVAELYGIELPQTNLLNVEADASYNGLSSYSATAAVEWAKAHWNEVNSVLWGTNYWDDGGDCANFVSQCIYMGGLDQTAQWNHAGYLAHYSNSSNGAFIRAQGLYDYVVSLGGTSVNNPAASDVSVGDLMFFSAVGYSRMTHSAIVIDIVNGVPILAAHSVRENGVPKKYVTTVNDDWHLGFLPSRTYLVKMYGDLCTAENPRSFDVYTAAGGDLRLYKGTSASSGYNTKFLSGEYVHVYSTVYANGYNWGLAYRHGHWGYIKLSSLNYQRHIDSYVPSHIFGEWQISKAATCTQSGLEERICSRCGYTETRGTTGEHLVTTAASCTEGAFCDLCGVLVEEPLGHNPGEWVTTKEPTCTETGEKETYCTRCNVLIETATIDALGHDYVHTSTAPTCTENGTAVYKCSRCDHEQLNYISDENTWTDWTEEVRSDIPEDKIITKTQYSYRDKTYLDSYTEDLEGYTLESSEWESTGSGSIDYGASWHGGFDMNNYYYKTYCVSPKTNTETSTTKTVVDSTTTKGYIYWHWCRGATDSSYLNYSRSVEEYYTDTYWCFHAFYSTASLSMGDGGAYNDGYVYSDANVCCDSYWWIADRVEIKTCNYTEYQKLFHYSQWSDWSDWSDEEITASDTREVQTRTLYRYDLAAYGHDFSEEDTDSRVEPTCLEPGHVGTLCSRCGVASPDTVVLPALGHDMGEWYTVGTHPDTNLTVERRDCQRTNCTYYELRYDGNEYLLTDTVEPTCEEEGYSIFESTDGSELKFYYVDPLGHENDGNFTVTKAPNCTEDGIKESPCIRNDGGVTCSKVFYESIPALGHTQETIPEIAPTCTEKGMTEGIKCSVCQEIILAPEEIDALGHLRTDENGIEPWVTVSEPSCGVNGVKRLYCQRETETTDENGNNIKCNELIEEILTPALTPEWRLDEEKPSTCIETGYVRYVCEICEADGKEHTYSDILEKTEHTWNDWSDETVASENICVITHRDCTVCGESEEYTKYDSHDFEVISIEGECVDGEKHVCLNCGFEKTVSDALSHEMGEWYTVTEASCTENGVERSDCVNGDYSITREIPATGHDWAVSSETDPTCTEWGHIIYVCNNDSTHTYGQQTDMPTGHNFSEKITDDEHLKTPATCFDAAVYYYDCTECETISNISYSSGSPLGHDYGEWTTVTPATCENDGLEQRICKNDASHTEENVLPAIGHDWDEGVIDPSSTCKDHGTKTYTCQNDNSHTYTEEVPLDPENHTGDTYLKDSKAETCTEDGYTGDIYCSDCDELLKNGEVIPAKGHDYGEWTTVTPATCENDGLEQRVCKNDASHTEENVLPATGHDYGEWVTVTPATCENDGLEQRVCKNDASHTEENVLPATGHDYGEWTTVTPATCENDGLEERICKNDASHTEENVLPAIGHDWDEGVIAPSSTCKDHGTKTYTCQNDSSHTYTEEVPLDPENHAGDTYIKDSKEETCTEDGYTGDIYCSDCDELLKNGEVIPAKGHDYGEWTTVTPATCENDGLEERVCKNDASHVEENVLPATGHDYGEWTTVTPATCENDGLEERVCKNDASHTEENVLPAHGHNYVYSSEKSKAPDYGIAGYEYYECTYDASHNYKVEIEPLVKSTFTATFITTAPFFTEDKTVGTVTFEQGDKYVDEPEVTSYDNYTFAWDEYELKDEDIVIYGRYTEIDVDKISTVIPEKTAEKEDEKVKITLSAKADTNSVQINTVKTKNVDVILVLDQSGSMAEKLSSSNETKRDALVKCANEFAEKIYNNAAETGADHRVAIVGFSYSEYNNGKYKNTGLFSGQDGSFINYADLTTDDYKNALISISDGDSIDSRITDAINSVTAEGATAAHLGLQMANSIFSVTPKESDRDRIVIFITDGTPTSWNEDTELVDSVAAKAITEANELKNSHGATVYSIGVHGECDTDAEFTSAENGITTDRNNNFQSFDFNRFLHAVSSNYPEATGMNVSYLGDGSKKSGYYLGVNDTDNLSSMFSKILLSKMLLTVSFDKVTLFDTLSKEFTLTLSDEQAMREYLINEKGLSNEDITVIRNEDGTTYLRFENVRAEKKYNLDGSSYYSASVSFLISPDEDSLNAEDAVKTNTEDAGIEYGDTVIGNFSVPEVVLESGRNLVVFTINGVVYSIDEALMGEEITAPENAPAIWVIPEGTAVTEEYTVFEANAESIPEYTVKWISENSEITQTYEVGSVITVPEAAQKEDYDFLKWSPAVPSSMPMYDITFTAVYTPCHVHEYTASSFYGDCEEGLITVFTCPCGDSYEEKADTAEHHYRAVVEKTYSGTLIDRIVCDVCGKENSQNLTYKVNYNENRRSYVLDLTLYENEVTVQPDGTLQIRFYLGDKINKNYTVYRIDENGTKTVYEPQKEDGYLIFDADHFSIYIVAETTDANKPYYELSYLEALCSLNGHDYKDEIIAPTCTRNGYTKHTCTVCNDSYTDSEKASLGHSFGEYVIVKEATCTENGLLRATCANCFETKDKETEKTEHDYSSDGYCSECGKEENDCPHLCHNDNPISEFVWSIIRFFCKLFGLGKTCSCGEAHY